MRTLSIRALYDRRIDARLPADTRMGEVHLTVSDLERSRAYYGEQIGLRVQRRENDTAALGAGGEDLLVLRQVSGARPADARRSVR
jgi:catechol-2,3-dioxygenase